MGKKGLRNKLTRRHNAYKIQNSVPSRVTENDYPVIGSPANFAAESNCSLGWKIVFFPSSCEAGSPTHTHKVDLPVGHCPYLLRTEPICKSVSQRQLLCKCFFNSKAAGAQAAVGACSLLWFRHQSLGSKEYWALVL